MVEDKLDDKMKKLQEGVHYHFKIRSEIPNPKYETWDWEITGFPIFEEKADREFLKIQVAPHAFNSVVLVPGRDEIISAKIYKHQHVK